MILFELLRGDLSGIERLSGMNFYQEFKRGNGSGMSHASVKTFPPSEDQPGEWDERPIAQRVYEEKTFTPWFGPGAGTEVAFKNVLTQAPPNEYGIIEYYCDLPESEVTMGIMHAFANALREEGLDEEAGSELTSTWQMPEEMHNAHRLNTIIWE